VRLLRESDTATPDLEIRLAPPVFAECKAKLRYEDSVIKFVERWRRTALADISAYLRQVNAGFIVRIALHDESTMGALASIVRKMVTEGLESRSEPAFTVEIVPIHSDPVEMGPDPMPVMSAEFWRQALGFDEWQDWHFVLPGGHFKCADRPNMLATEFQRPTLVCVRSTRLAENEIRVLPSLRRQFRTHSPGALHVLINANLFGLDTRCSLDYVEAAVTHAAQQLLREYTRTFAVIYDVMKPPEPGQYRVIVRRVTVAEYSRWPSHYREPPRILLY
jgi:hypothetical protein